MADASAMRAGDLNALYAVVYTAIRNRQPMSAVYHMLPRLFCPHRLGRNSKGQLRVLCYQHGGASRTGLAPQGSPDNWRCIALDQLSAIRLLNGQWHTAANHLRPASCIPDPDIDAEDYPERDPRKGQTRH